MFILDILATITLFLFYSLEDYSSSNNVSGIVIIELCEEKIRVLLLYVVVGTTIRQLFYNVNREPTCKEIRKPPFFVRLCVDCLKLSILRGRETLYKHNNRT